MDIVEIAAKEDSPYVLLNPHKGIIEIKGRSYPARAQDFYAPILKWVKKTKNLPLSELEVDISLEYFNTTSFKIIFDLLFELESIEDAYGINMKINWHYDSPDVKEAGVDLSELLKLSFQFKQVGLT